MYFCGISSILFTSVYSGVITDAKPVSMVLFDVFFTALEIVAIVMVISFVLSGAMIIFSNGDLKLLQRSKRAFLYSVTGVLVCLGLYVTLNFVIEIFG